MEKESLVFKLRVLPLVLLGCCAWVGKAQAGYLPPRLSLDANAGGSATVGQADLLLSLKGDERRNLYLDPQAAYGTDEQWYTDLGLGYRWIQNDAAILGGYIFAGHSQVANQNGFWIANPGIEALGSRWDARINGYIPIGSRQDDMGIFRFNQSSRLAFTGHSESLITNYVYGDELQEIGDGVDAKVGYQVLRGLPLKAYLGAYFFDLKYTDNVRGGAAGLEYWFDHNVKVFANYTYDNLQHSTVVGGLAVSFGGVDESRADPSLSERLTDPVERYLANLGHGSGIPSQTMLINLQTGVERVLNAGSINSLPGGSGSQIIANNIAYFSASGSPNGTASLTLANCTFENPCGPNDFTQTNVNTLNSLIPSTQMFFNGGTYSATNGTSALTLNNGQGVFGTSANYSAPASGAARPTFSGAFILTGNNTLDSIILSNSLGATTVAISSTGGQNLAINNTNIGSLAVPYGVAMILSNASASLNGTTVNVSLQAGTISSMISLSGTSSLVVKSSTLSLASSAGISPTGISLFNNSLLQLLNNSQVNVTVSGFAPAVGIIVNDNATALISNSSVTSSGSTSLQSFGLQTVGGGIGSIEMTSGNIAVSGAGNSLPRSGSNIVIGSGVSCTRNGTSIPC
ncbi:MAG: hypothetical protein RLZZ225_639 [Pseudomonadota bacterium]